MIRCKCPCFRDARCCVRLLEGHEVHARNEVGVDQVERIGGSTVHSRNDDTML